MRDYEYQMRVYHELYCQQKGSYAARAMLVFVGELGDDKAWDAAGLDARKFPKLLHPVLPGAEEIRSALQDFHQTIELIESERVKPYGQQWFAPNHDVDDQTCEVCELRYRCDRFPRGAQLRKEAL
jgi:hypothetical protein